MKMFAWKIMMLSTLGLTAGSAWATNGELAAELYVRSLVKKSASLAGSTGGLCGLFSSSMNVSFMAEKITSEFSWSRASEGDKAEFKKSFLKFMVDNAIERLSSNTRVSGVDVSGGGNAYIVSAKITGDQERSAKYYLSVRESALNQISDAELAALKDSGSGSATESKLKRAFSIYEVYSRGTKLTSYLKQRYLSYANSSGRPGLLHPDFFHDIEETQGRCP